MPYQKETKIYGTTNVRSDGMWNANKSFKDILISSIPYVADLLKVKAHLYAISITYRSEHIALFLQKP